jgi:hypothetical protein
MKSRSAREGEKKAGKGKATLASLPPIVTDLGLMPFS